MDLPLSCVQARHEVVTTALPFQFSSFGGDFTLPLEYKKRSLVGRAEGRHGGSPDEDM